jgi:hypothetical protein
LGFICAGRDPEQLALIVSKPFYFACDRFDTPFDYQQRLEQRLPLLKNAKRPAVGRSRLDIVKVAYSVRGA